MQMPPPATAGGGIWFVRLPGCGAGRSSRARRSRCRSVSGGRASATSLTHWSRSSSSSRGAASSWPGGWSSGCWGRAVRRVGRSPPFRTRCCGWSRSAGGMVSAMSRVRLARGRFRAW